MLISKEKFEQYTAVATPRKDLLIIFQMNEKEMDSWCWENYRMRFKDVYTLMLKMSLAEYKSAMQLIAESGNSTAIQTMNKILMDMGNESDLNITINGAVPVEDNDND